MTTVAEKKLAQGYKTTPETCSNCASMACRQYHYEDHKDSSGRIQRVVVIGKESGTCFFEDTFRCSIGGFAVKKLSTCQKWSMRS